MQQKQDSAQAYLCTPHSPSLPLLPPASSYSLLPAIQDQQIYICAINTLLTLARQSGASPSILSPLAEQLLAARGLSPCSMLQNSNQSQEALTKRRERYNWLEHQSTPKEMRRLLEKLQKEALLARQKERQVSSLKGYIRRKEEQIAPGLTTAPSSRKERFKKVLKAKYSRTSVKNSNFYQFSQEDILKNSYRADNQCYSTMSNFTHLKTMFGHSSDQQIDSYIQIFNAIYDRTQKLLISGGQQGLIKVWHRHTGTLITNLKGHTDFINKIEVSPCNRYLISCAGDGIRFFDMATLKPWGGWRSGSIVQIVTIVVDGSTMFAFGDDTNLYVLTEQTLHQCEQGTLSKNDFTIINFKNILVKNNGAIIVISPSPDKNYLLLGLQNGQIVVMSMAQILGLVQSGLKGQSLSIISANSTKIHTDQIVEVKWCDSSQMWATGSKDGLCCLFQIRNNQPRLLESLSVNRQGKGRKKRVFACSFVCWNCTYSHFAAGFQQIVDQQDIQRGQGEVLVYNMQTRKVTCQLSRDVSLRIGGIKAMDAHPHYPNILLICQAQGHIILFDLFLGNIVNVFEQRGYHIMHPQFCLNPSQCRFAQDGLSFLVATQYGSLSLYGYDSPVFYTMSPSQQFLATDFSTFAIKEGTMQAIPLTLPFEEDINQYPRGQIRTIKGEQYQNIIKIDKQELLQDLLSRQNVQKHFAQNQVEQQYLRKVVTCQKNTAILQNSYQKTYQQIQGSKQLIIFHQKQRQFARINSLVTSKLHTLQRQIAHNNKMQTELSPSPQKQQQIHRPRTRNRGLKRYTQADRINYIDDFQDNSQQQDYNQIQDQLQQQLPQDHDDSDSQQQPRQSRFRRQHRRNTRITRQYAHQQQDFPEERITRRRKQLHGVELEEEQSMSRPRKKVKIEDQFQSEQPPKQLSRLKKGITEEDKISEEFQSCYRCQINKATRYCYGCDYTQRYCQSCAVKRGKHVHDKYQCLICLFLKNDTTQQRQKVTETPYRVTQYQPDHYLPQLGDQIRFFFQGYQQFLLQNISKLNNRVARQDQSYRLLPHTQNIDLLNTPLCRVQTIKYYYPVKQKTQQNIRRIPGRVQQSPILMLLGLVTQQQYNFQIFYIPTDIQFLLLQQIYSRIDTLTNLDINQLLTYQNQQVQIVQLTPLQDRFPQSRYKMVKIRKSEGKRLRGNTKDVQKRVNIWRIQQIDVDVGSFKLQDKKKKRLMEELNRFMTSDEESQTVFRDYVDFQIWPEYRNVVPVGICLDAILSRITNKYYRSEVSLREDINLIHKNSVLFNGIHHNVTKWSIQLVNNLLALISDQQLPPTAKKTNDDSNQKRGRIKQHIQDSHIIEQSFKGANLRSRTKREMPKRRKQSSQQFDQGQYDQQESFDYEEIGITTRGGRSRVKEPKRMTRSQARP